MPTCLRLTHRVKLPILQLGYCLRLEIFSTAAADFSLKCRGFDRVHLLALLSCHALLPKVSDPSPAPFKLEPSLVTLYIHISRA